MASPCLGCGTTTDSSGNLTIYGARSSAWKTRYGASLDDRNGLRCDPVTGKLWTAPPTKFSTWTIGVGTWNAGFLTTSSLSQAYYVWIGTGDAGATAQLPLTGTTNEVSGKTADANDASVKKYVASGQSLTFDNNDRDEEQTLMITTNSRLGAGTLYGGRQVSTARGAAGVELTFEVTNGSNSTSTTTQTLESYFYSGTAVSSTAVQSALFSHNLQNCSRTDVLTVEAGGSLKVTSRPYYRSAFSNVGLMAFYWDFSPRTVVTAVSSFRHSDSLDAP